MGHLSIVVMAEKNACSFPSTSTFPLVDWDVYTGVWCNTSHTVIGMHAFIDLSNKFMYLPKKKIYVVGFYLYLGWLGDVGAHRNTCDRQFHAQQKSPSTWCTSNHNSYVIQQNFIWFDNLPIFTKKIYIFSRLQWLELQQKNNFFLFPFFSFLEWQGIPYPRSPLSSSDYHR